MSEGLQKALGTGLGCLFVGALAVLLLPAIGLLLVAFPLTSAIVALSVATLYGVKWQRRRSARHVDIMPNCKEPLAHTRRDQEP